METRYSPNSPYGAMFPVDGSGSVSAAAITLWPIQVIVGRRRACHVVIDDPYVSALHCELVFERQGWSIRDLGSKNGTRVNGRTIETSSRLNSGDTLAIGRRRFVIRFNDSGN